MQTLTVVVIVGFLLVLWSLSGIVKLLTWIHGSLQKIEQGISSLDSSLDGISSTLDFIQLNTDRDRDADLS